MEIGKYEWVYRVICNHCLLFTIYNWIKKCMSMSFVIKYDQIGENKDRYIPLMALKLIHEFCNIYLP